MSSELNLLLDTNPLGTHPVHYDENQRFYFSLVSLPIFSLSKEWRWECQLCVQMPSRENGLVTASKEKKDQIEIHLQLANVKWADGRQITGHDIEFSWKVTKKLLGPLQEGSYLNKIKNIKVDPIDAKRVTVFYETNSTSWTDLAKMNLIPRRSDRLLWRQQDESSYLENSSFVTKPFSSELYNGPFRVANHIPEKNYVLLERNPHYKGNVSIHRIKVFYERSSFMKAITDEPAKTTFLIPPSIKQGMKVTELTGTLRRYSSDSTLLEHISINLRNPILRDVKVRRALAYTAKKLNFEKIIGTSEITLTDSFLHPSDPLHVDARDQVEYSDEGLDSLLRESGWLLDPKSGIRFKDGKSLHIEIDTTRSLSHRPKLVEAITNQWKKLGAEIKINWHDPKVFYHKILRYNQYKGVVLFAWEQNPGTFPVAKYYSLEIPSIKNKYRGQNASSWTNRHVDNQLIAMKMKHDEKVTKDAMSKTQSLFFQEIPEIPLFFIPRHTYLGHNLKGYMEPGHQFPSSLFIGQWTVSSK